MKRLIAIGLLILASSAIAANRLEVVGVVGNSGETGGSLFQGIVGRCGGGVAKDAQGRLFVGAGDRILVLNRDGKKLWQYELPQPDWVLAGPTFALAGDMLYFIAGKSVAIAPPTAELLWRYAEGNLCRVRATPGAKVEILATAESLKLTPITPDCDVCVTAQPGTDHVFLARGYYTPDRTFNYNVFEISPADGKLRSLFDHGGSRVSVDEDGNFYLFGSAVVEKVDRAGKPLPSFPVKLSPPGMAVPTMWSGLGMLTRDAIWESAVHGFVGRFSRDGQANPGTVVQFQKALRWVQQIIDGPQAEQYYMRSIDALYLTELREGQLRLLRRFGSLPAYKTLLLTRDGYVIVSDGQPTGMLWFDFDSDDPAAAPVKAGYDGPTCQQALDGDGKIYGYSHDAKTLYFCRFNVDPAGDFASVYNQAETPLEPGAAVEAGGFIFAIDAKSGGLLRAPVSEPVNLSAISGGAPHGPIASLCVLGSKMLLTAGATGGTVEAFDVGADGALKSAWRLTGSGEGAAAAFGDDLHIATYANLLLVADSHRHRVALFNFPDDIRQPPAFQHQLGETDHPGEDMAHFNLPTLVSIQGGKAVVYDSGNQRVVKLRVK